MSTVEYEVVTPDGVTDPIPGAFLRQTMHQAIADLLGRIAARDPDFDADAERAKIAFLIDEEAAPDAQAVPDATTPAAERMSP